MNGRVELWWVWWINLISSNIHGVDAHWRILTHCKVWRQLNFWHFCENLHLMRCFIYYLHLVRWQPSRFHSSNRSQAFGDPEQAKVSWIFRKKKVGCVWLGWSWLSQPTRISRNLIGKHCFEHVIPRPEPFEPCRERGTANGQWPGRREKVEWQRKEEEEMYIEFFTQSLFKSNSPPPPNFPTKVFQSGSKIGKRLLLVIKEESLERRNWIFLHRVCVCVCSSSPPLGGLDKYRDTFSKCPPLGHSPAGNGHRALGKSSKRGWGGWGMLGLDMLAFGMGWDSMVPIYQIW